ncbi:MAG: hypothetical protein K0V04_10555 [Deltaproteobacteria bacterium]|nr:hypothetical protein [Deltaproteobacteria bacterium]
MLGETNELTVDAQWHPLVHENPVVSIDPPVYVFPVPGGMLFRTVVPGNPVVFVPNIGLADLQGQT